MCPQGRDVEEGKELEEKSPSDCAVGEAEIYP
jgi:hypothetical protein